MIDLSSTSRLRVYVGTAMGTAICILLAFAIDSYSFETGKWSLADRAINNLMIPLMIAPPFFLFLLTKLRELSLAHRELLALSTTDSLTNCLNRRAFSSLVDAYLERIEGTPDRGKGALLILDVDHFKAVNDRYGHARGDDALKLIADVIKTNVREVDLVSRLGGEEFGVFLPGLDTSKAIGIAERIREAVSTAEFSQDGERHALSLSIGGVTFTPPANFSQLYRDADQRLYAAKHAGRNRVVLDGASSLAQQAARLS
jgi:diguanylate cyclase